MAVLLFCIFVTVWCSALSQYTFFHEHKTWFEAQKYCSEHHSDLATVLNSADISALIATEGTTSLAWIGLYDDATKWMWSMDNTDLNGAGFTNWAPANPNYFSSYQSDTHVCVSMENGGLWNDRSCYEYLEGPCDDSSGITSGWVSTWFGLQSFCRVYNKDLASVRDEIKNAAVDDMYTGAAWIGLYRHAWANWSDGTVSSFSNWDDSMNDYLNTTAHFHCAMIDTETGTWFRGSCDLKLHFICNTGKVPPGYTNRFKLSLKTEANLNNAAIRRQILEQIHDELRKHGLSDLQLRWSWFNKEV